MSAINETPEDLKERMSKYTDVESMMIHINFRITKFDYHRMETLVESGVVMNKSEGFRTAVSNYLDVKYDQIPYIPKPTIKGELR